MELKNTNHNNFIGLLKNSIFEKKNWFMISFITLFVTSVLIPLLLTEEISDVGVGIAIFELFVVVFLNCIIDFSYLHDSRKFSYYMSKPITNMQKINIILITNIIFTSVFVVFLAGVSYFVENSMTDAFIVIIPWLIIGIFLSALSSILSGNSIVAGISTCFNFLLPLSILAVIYYIFYIIETVAVGFSAEILMNTFIEQYYKIENLYFVKYDTRNFDLSYFVILFLVVGFIYYLTIRLLKKRKNEKIGDFIVYDGYKNFIAILISSLIPIAFSTMLGEEGFITQILAFVILASLSYYIILVILEKSFRISRNSIKILIAFLTIFLVFVGAANIGTNKFESYIPNENEISSVYVGYSSWVYSDTLEKSDKIYNISEDEADKYNNITVYRNTKNIFNIVKFHESLIKSRFTSENNDVVIVYNLNNGKNVVRYYKMVYNENYDGALDGIAKNIVLSDEYKSRNFGFVYDDKISEKIKLKSMIFHNGNYSKQEDIDLSLIDINVFREKLKLDYDKYFEDTDNNLDLLLYGSDSFPRKTTYRDNSIENDKEGNEYIIELKSYGDDSITLYLDEGFKNTIEYIQKYEK